MPFGSTATWIVAAYRVPSTPSTARVAAWRGLRELGAVILGPAVFAVPAAVAGDRRYELIVRRINAAGGSVEQLEIAAFAPEAEARLRERHNAARDDLYRDVARRAAALIQRIEGDVRDGQTTFERLERHEVDLVRLRRSLHRVTTGDVFEASGRAAAVAAVEQATAAVASFGRETLKQEPVPSGSGAAAGFDPLFEGADLSVRPTETLAGRDDADAEAAVEDDEAA